MKIHSIHLHARLRALQGVACTGALLSALALGLAGTAAAQPAPPMADAAGAMHPAWGHDGHDMSPGMGGGMHEGMHEAMGGGMHEGMMHRGMDPRRIHRMLEVMKATPEQHAQVRAIIEKAHADIQALRRSSQASRGQMHALFEQPTIDAKAAESLRQQMSAQRDQIGKRMLQARIDVANVFTPAQRQALISRVKEHRALLERQRAEREAFAKRAP